MHRVIIVVLLLLLSSQRSNAQSQDSIPGTGIEAFKDWLKNSWLSPHIYLDTVQKRNDLEYIILELNCDSNCTSLWKGLKQSFDSLSSFSLEEFLWRKLVFHLNSPREKIVLEIYNKTNPGAEPCFLRSIYMGSLRAESNCKDLGGEVLLNFKIINPVFKLNVKSRDKINSQTSQLLDTIYKKSVRYYGGKGGKVKLIHSSYNRLEFAVEGLRNEVVPNKMFGGSIERFEFIIKCTIESGGVKFETMVNGGFGNGGILKPVNRRGYKDLERQFKDEFQEYVDEFTNNKIRNWLQ